jgi:hypothetical protein
MTTKTRSMLDFSVESLAGYICYSEARIFRRIRISELMDVAWTKSNRRETSPYVVEMVDRTNRLSFTIAFKVCTCTDLKERIALVSAFISLAQALYELGNFNGLMEVIGGLGNSAVERLKHTWAVSFYI